MIIDVRSEAEFATGHKEGAVNIPVNIIMQAVVPVSKDHKLELYCSTGSRAKMAELILKHRGFTNVELLGGTGAL